MTSLSERAISELIEEAKNGSDGAFEEVLRRNSALIWSIVRRFFGRGTDAEDLYQIGCIGLVKAVRGYDADFGTVFSTYAVPKISGEIRRFLRDDGMIKVSRTTRENAAKIALARKRLSDMMMRSPHLSEISEETGLSVEEIAVCESAAAPPESLQRDITGEGMTIEDTLSAQDRTGDELIERIDVGTALEKLPDREKNVIYLRFFKGMTQDMTAKKLNISQVQVSRIEKKALLLIREKIG